MSAERRQDKSGSRLLQSARDGWALGGEAIALVRGQPGLRRYLGWTFSVLLTIQIAAAATVLHFRHQGTIPQRLVAVLVTGYLVAVMTNAAAVGLAGLSNTILSGETAEAREGWRLTLRRLPNVAGWSLLVLAIGIPSRLLTSWGVDQLAAVLLGFGWGVISFFAIPAIALTAAGPIAAAERSFRLVRRFWVGQVAGTVYVWMRPALFIGLPGAVALLTGIVLERSGTDLLGWTIALGGAVALAVAYLIMVASKSILSIAIFRFAEAGEAPPGFDGDRLQRMMVGPSGFVERIGRRLETERVRRLRERLAGEHERN